MSAWWRLTRHGVRLQRRQSLTWIAAIAFLGPVTVRAYTSTYPTAVKRDALAATMGGNVGIQALYGVARNINTVGGFITWRLTWYLATFTALWGLLAATRMIRGEEESGRRELLLAGPVSAASLLGADLLALAIPLALCGAAFGAALAASGVPAGGAFVIAAGIIAPGFLFGALGAFTAQLYPDRRHAMGVGGAVLGASFLVRAAADGGHTLGWLRWATPLGWVENIRPFAGTDLRPIVPLALATLLLGAGSFVVLAHRDFATGFVTVNDRGRAESPMLRNSLRFTIKQERFAIVSWSVGVGAFALVFGMLSKDVAAFMRKQPQLHDMFAKLGVSHLDRPQDFLGLIFTFFALPIAIFAATQVSAVREEEANGRLEALLVRPLGRARWLLGRCLVGALGAVAVALSASTLAFAGAALQHAGVGWVPMAVAGLNCLAGAAPLFGLAVLCFGVVPRFTPAFALGSVIVAYLIELVGALVKAPGWVLDLSPFHHLAPVPAAPTNAVAAIVMVAIGAAGVAAGVVGLRRRDLAGA